MTYYNLYDVYYKEPHSADGKTYIEKKVDGQWEVWLNGTKVCVLKTRTRARNHIRILKKVALAFRLFSDRTGFISDEVWS